jgi:hypothetical protein
MPKAKRCTERASSSDSDDAPFAPQFSFTTCGADTKGHPELVKVARIGQTGDEPKYLALKYGDSSGSKNFDMPVDARTTLVPCLQDLPVASLKNTFPNRTYAAGATLSGKSWLLGAMAREFVCSYPSSRVVLVTSLESDPAYAMLEDLLSEKGRFVRLLTDEAFGDDVPEDEQIKMGDLRGRFKKVLVLFDDWSQAASPSARKACEVFMNKCLSAGRHYGISLALTNQVALGGAKTVNTITNSFSAMLFPNSSSRHHCIAFMKKYVGLNQETIDRLLALPTRWLFLQRCVPRLVISEYHAELL